MAVVRAGEASTSRCTYHVFLSFRGEDTRKTFTDHLYTALVHAGFRTFRDEEEIERGEKINMEVERAIKQSRISIVVFSKNYTSSRWCLDELVMILERRRTSGHVVLPVFYDVEPSQIKNQLGDNISETFARLEERFKAEINRLEAWRASLREVADLGGMVFANQADRHESKFIQKIVKEVGDKLSRMVLNVAPYLIGIHSQVKNINLWLQDGSIDVGMIVISGMGGIGKTTIAKFIYNRNFERFEGSSFLANVREISKQPNGLVRLQRQLLSDILKRKKEKICSVDEGIIKIKDAICCKRVLVVLDDVDQVDQLNAILGVRDWFYPGSKIIITTRHERLLKAREVYRAHKVEKLREVYRVHEVEKLDDNESLELFSWHAFGQDHPIECYMEHSKRIVQHCGGLPLALQVIGSLLAGKSVVVWESASKKMEEICESQILEKLKISYDSLQDDHDKNLFLHIACFFVGKDRDFVIEILDKCDFYTAVGIENLIDRSLLTIDKNNKLMMHQLLRDMGREIIRQESPMDPGKRSRLWQHKDSFNVLREETGTETVEGLILDMHMFKEDESTSVNNAKKRRFEEVFDKSWLIDQGNSLKRRHCGFFLWHPVNTTLRNVNEIELEIDALARMPKLRLLQLNYVQLTGCYKEFPKRLRWLCWHGFPLKSIPSDFPLGSLVALDLRYSSLKQVWEGTKFLGLLKILNLSHSHSLAKTPDFSALPNLEKLILKDCTSLVEVHESIGKLERLVFLNLKDSTNLRKLPKNIVTLKSLETLIISGCSNLDELPMELRRMESLKVLHADGIAINQLLSTTREVKPWHAFIWSWLSKPTKSPEISWASLPRFLVRLSLVDCNLSDDAFPRDFNNLSLLQNLNLSKNPICSLPDCIKGLTRLQTLCLHFCTGLHSLLGLPNVEKLFVGHCISLEKITFQSTLFGSQQIEHTKCEKLVEIQDVFKLQPIRNLDTEMINEDLGFFNLESMANVEVNFFNGCLLDSKKIPIQGLYECGVFSTFIPGREVPGCFSDKSTGSSISFTLPSLPNLRIQGINVCTVYALSDNEEHWHGAHSLSTEFSNNSKNLKWSYRPMCFGVPEADEDMIWLSHWNIINKLEGGDDVNVSVVIMNGFKLKEFGIQVLYQREAKKGTQHNTLPYCQDGINLLTYHVRSGRLFSRDDFDLPMPDWGWHDKLFQDSATSKDEECREEMQHKVDLALVAAGTSSDDKDGGCKGQQALVVVTTRKS